VDFGPILVASF